MNHNPVLVNVVDARSVRSPPNVKVVEDALVLQPDTSRARPCSRVVVVNLDSASHVSDKRRQACVPSRCYRLLLPEHLYPVALRFRVRPGEC